MTARQLLFRIIGAFILGVLPLAAPAQWGMPSVVQVEAKLDPAEVRPGEQVRLLVTATIDPQYHLYGIKQPTDEPGPTPTSIPLDDVARALLSPAGEWKEPDPVIKVDPGFEIKVAYLYGSPLEFSRTFTVSPGAEAGSHTISGKFHYQACTETSCLPPMDAEFSVPLKVLEGGPVAVAAVPTPEATPEASPAPEEPAAAVDVLEESDATAIVDDTAAAIVSNSSFGRFMFTAFVLGLLALLTPCVFPMIPITITFFTDKKAESSSHAVRNAAIYVLSIILGFTVIGFGFSILLRVFQAGVESSGFANMIAANPWINLFFGSLYVVFALSLFGLFEFRLPTGLSQRLNQKALKGGGVAGIFFKALVFVVISFTCTAPLLGVLIVQAVSGAWTRPLFGMMAFATGFAAPFFFLALVPQMLSHLPRSGSWLYATKIVMGMIVLAAAVKFLSNCDLIWLGENMLLTRELILSVWTAIAAIIALYLFGLIRLKEEGAEEGIGAVRMMIGTVFAVISLYLASGLFGGRLHLWIEAYMPQDLRPSAQVATSGGGDEELFEWHDAVEPALAQARAEGKNVFIDFSGYTCTNCRLMEKSMFPRPEVAELMRKYVLVRLYTDDPDTGKQWQAYQARLFNTVALPFYAVVTPDEKVLAKAEYTRDTKKFVDFLESGLGKQVAKAP